MLNRSEILKAAWAGYRLARPAVYAAGDHTGKRCFLPALFARQLRAAWGKAKAAAITFSFSAPVEAKPVVSLPVADRAARAATIEAELRAMDFSDAPINWSRRLDLRAELTSLGS